MDSALAEIGVGAWAVRPAASSARNFVMSAGVSVVVALVSGAPIADTTVSVPHLNDRVVPLFELDEPLVPRSAGSGASSSSSIRFNSAGGAASSAWIGGASASRAAGAAGALARFAIAPHPASTSTATRPARSLTTMSVDPGSAEQHVEPERQPWRQFTELVERQQHTGCE